MVNLRKAKADDVETLSNFWFNLAKDMEEYDVLNEVRHDNVNKDITREFEKQINNTEITNYLIEVDDIDIGFITLTYGRHSSRIYSDYMRIINFYISDEYQSNGYGTDIINQIKERAKSEDLDMIKVSFEYNNRRAWEFYSDNGFDEKQVDSVFTINL